MNFDTAFLHAARQRLALIERRIQDARNHARWHPRNEWEAFTGDPHAHAVPATARVGVAEMVRGLIERSRKVS